MGGKLFILFLVLVLAVIACGQPPDVVEVQDVFECVTVKFRFAYINRCVDAGAGVVCYMYSDYGISCVPLRDTRLDYGR